MKRIYFFSVLLLSGATVMAQSVMQQELTVSKLREVNPLTPGTDGVEETDTLNLAEFGEEAWLYSSQVGYVFGTSDLEDDQTLPPLVIHQYSYEFASGYLVNSAYNVKGAMLWFGAKEAVSATPAAFKVKMYSLADNKAYGSEAAISAQQPDAIGPNQMLKTVDVPFDDAVLDGSTIVLFPQTQWINQDFGIGVDIQANYNGNNPADTLALYASAQNASDGEYTWTKLGFSLGGQTFWAKSTLLLQGGLNVYLAIFAIVDESLASIEEAGFINGVNMLAYPNPAVSSDNIRIDYTLESAAKSVEIRVFDMSGKLVHTLEEGSRQAGVHTVNIASGSIAPGSYIYAISADGRRIAKQMEVVR